VEVGRAASGQDLARDSVIAGFAAGVAIVQAILAEADLHLRLAKTTVLFTVAAFFRPLALEAAVLGLGTSGGHGQTVARPRERTKCRW